jgi:hypothetical protein
MRRRTLLVLLLMLFITSFVANYVYLTVYASSFTPSSGPVDYVSKIGRVIVLGHGAPLGILIGGIFVKRAAGGRISLTLAMVAIVLSIAWIGYVGLAWVGYPDRFLADAFLSKISERPKEATIFIGGMLSYLCGAEVKEPQG